ncbi:MAG TPA: GNAT family N-acetyltransferase, partial [Rikenellaceae bacterium]|nr:GNAT family N-acetyltransferase [Rikenellaceae bacterium]
MEVDVMVAEECHTVFADQICEEIYTSSLERKTGIAKRTPEYICEKIRAGKAVIALSEDGRFAGFSYIESWGGKSFVANSGLIVAHAFRGMGIAKRIKEQTFLLSRRLFPDAKIFSITTGAAVMKMNYEFGFRPVPFTELTDDPEFWKGCEGCRHFDILK